MTATEWTYHVLLAQATSHLGDVAKKVRRLRGFTHISTAYVSSPQDRNSHVEERIYPLGSMDGQLLEHRAIARSFDPLAPEAAEVLVCTQWPGLPF